MVKDEGSKALLLLPSQPLPTNRRSGKDREAKLTSNREKDGGGGERFNITEVCISADKTRALMSVSDCSICLHGNSFMLLLFVLE